MVQAIGIDGQIRILIEGVNRYRYAIPQPIDIPIGTFNRLLSRVCCPAATTPIAVVFVCAVCCCIAGKKQTNKQTTEKQSSAVVPGMLRLELILHEYENNTHKANQALSAWCCAGRSSRSTRPVLSSSEGACSCRVRSRCLLLYSSQNRKGKPKAMSPFYSKLQFFREGFVSEVGSAPKNRGVVLRFRGVVPTQKSSIFFWNSKKISR